MTSAVDKLAIMLAMPKDKDADEAGENEPTEGTPADLLEDISEAVDDLTEALNSVKEALAEAKTQLKK